MKILKVVFWVLMVAALVGGVYLVRMNQETRRGAASNDAVLSIQPDGININKDENISLMVWANTGSATDKMVGGEFQLNFDRLKLEYVSTEVQQPYSLVNDGLDGRPGPNSGSGPLQFKVVSQGTLKTGAFGLVKVTFKVLAQTGGIIVTPSGRMVIDGQDAYWTVENNQEGNYTVGSSGTTPGMQACDRCSTIYKYQRVKYQATDCNAAVDAGVEVTRTYDGTCTSPSDTATTCNRCSTTTNHEYVWWTPASGKTCSDDPAAEVTIYRATNSNCILNTDCTGSEKKCVGGIPTMCVGGSWQTMNACASGKECSEGACVDIAASDECQTDNNCKSSEKCNASKKCEELVCDTLNITECKVKNVLVDHQCPTLGNKASGTACTNGTCQGGLCIVASCISSGETCGTGNLPENSCSNCCEGAYQDASRGMVCGLCSSNSQCRGDTSMCVNGTCVGITPTITPPVDNNSLYLNFKTTMVGVVAGNRCIAGDGWKAKIIVKNSIGSSMVYTNVQMVRDGEIGTKAVYRVSLKLTGWTTKDDLLVFVKGPKHMQMKFGEDGQKGIYNSLVGKISLDNGENSPILDFTGYPLMPGDINMDGVINGEDFSLVKTKVSTHETFDNNTYRQEDLDGNCQYNGLDTILLSNSLDTKQDEIY